jgi:hypothetical protein
VQVYGVGRLHRWPGRDASRPPERAGKLALLNHLVIRSSPQGLELVLEETDDRKIGRKGECVVLLTLTHRRPSFWVVTTM